MKISFFEEYPTKENLAKLSLIRFNAKIFIAAKSLEEFNRINLPKRFEKVYWPVLSESEGYWLSPWAKAKAVKRIFSELHGKHIPVMLDLEFPRRKYLIISQIFSAVQGYRLVRNFIKSYKGKIYTSEYMFDSGILNRLLFLSGLSFSPALFGSHMIKMLYSSMHNFSESFMRSEMETGVKKYGQKFAVALGVTAIGQRHSEPIITAERLEKDITLCKRIGISEVIIFRLGGINREYMNAIRSTKK